MASSLSVELPVVFGSCYGNFLDGADECAKCSFAAECAQYCIERGIAMSEDFNLSPKALKELCEEEK